MGAQPKPWERQPGESARAFAAFCVYRDMGSSRSHEAVSEELGKTRQNFGAYSARHGWVERAAAYDQHVDAIERAAIEKARAVEAAKWAKRQAEQREREWDMAGKLLERAAEMLAYPLERQTIDDEQITIEPARWSMRDAASMADTAVKLARLAAEMATALHRNLEDLSDDELREIRDSANVVPFASRRRGA